MAKSAYRLEDVDYDPFAPKEEAKPKYKLEDVDYDPFAKKTAKKEPEQEGPTVLPQEDTSSDFMRGIANYLPQLQETYGAAKALTGVGLTRMGATDVGKSILESGLESMKSGQGKQVAKESDSFTNAWEKGIGTVVTDWLPYQAGAGAANIAESLAAMGIGAGVGALTGAGVGAAPGAVAGVLSKTLIKTGAKELAEKVLKEQGEEAAQKFIINEAKKALVSKGKVAGMVGQAGLHGAGEVTGRAIEEAEKRGERAEDIELARVVPAAMVHAVSDYFINKIGLDSMKIGEGASKYLVADILKRIAVTGTKELPAEELQTAAERFGAKLSLADAEALKEYIDTAAATYGMSSMPGGIGGVRTHLANKFATAAKEAEENADIKRTATSAQNDVAKVEPPANPQLVAALTPSTDENGTALAEASEDTVKAAEALTNPVAEAVTAVDESTKEAPAAKAEDVAKAEEYIQKIDSGEVQPNPSTLGAIIKKLGIPRPEKGPNFRERAVAAIKEHLSGTGQPTVTPEPIADTGGTSTALATPASTEQPAAGGAPVAEPSRVVSDGTVTPTTTVGEGQQPPALAGPAANTEEQITAAFELAKQIEDQEAAEAEAAHEESLGAGKPARYSQKNLPEYAKEDYEDLRETLEDENLPEWDALTGAEKDIYFGNIVENTIEERETAARKVSDFRNRHAKENLTPQQQSIVNGYEEDRAIQSEEQKLNFPAWTELSPAAKLAYLNHIVNNAGTQRQKGFDAVAAQLEAEGNHVRGVTTEGANNLRLMESEENRRQQAVGEAEQERAKAEEAVGKGEPLDDSVVKALFANDINGAVRALVNTAKGLSSLKPQRGELQYAKYLADRWSKASKFIFQFVARRLTTIPLNSNIVIDPFNATVERLQSEGKLAEYDPKTDTFYFTLEGLDEATFLHEVVHAATVKLIHTYLTDPSKLTDTQRQAMEHLDKIYQFAKKRLGNKFKNAFENLYEFIGYAMTDNKFQNELADIQARSLAKYTLNGEALWKQLTKMFQKLYGLVTAKGQKLAPAPEIYDALVASITPIQTDDLYELATDEDGVTTLELGDLTPGQEAEIREKRQAYKQGKHFLGREKGYEGNVMLEISEIFSNILSVPEAGTDVEPLAAKKSGAAARGAKTVPTLRTADLNKDNDEYNLKVDEKPKNWKYFHKLLGTVPGWQKMARLFQNDRYAIKAWESTLDLAGKIIREGQDKINNIYEQIVLASGDARNFYNVYVSDAAERMDKSVAAFAKAAGFDTEKALNKLHMIAEALHEPERRMVKYLLSVPLSDNKVLTQNGVKISPAERRAQIIKILDNHKLSEAQAKQLRTELNNLVFSDVANKIPSKYVDAFGKSPKEFTPISVKDPAKRAAQAAARIDLNSNEYNATGLDQASVKNITAQYNAHPQKAQIDDVLSALQDLHNATADLNQIANYWSDPVSNRVAFYDFKNYVPLKGNPHHTAVDEELDFDSAKNGRELQDSQGAMDGRVSVSKNPILQTMSDATRAAMRAGRRNLTQAIKNSLKQDKKLNPNGQGILDGYVKKTIPFEERNTTDLKDLKGETTIFHYNKDGSIDVLVIKDQKQREAIRRTYKQTKPIVDIANKATSFFGKMHTRYNYQFAPMNFARDALTNAFTIGAELGPVEAARFIKEITTMVVAKNGLYKAMQVAILYEKGDSHSQAALQQLAKKDPYINDMVEFIKTGGMVSYLQGMSLKSNFQDLKKEVGRSGVLRTKEQMEKFVDIWTDMFELASRAAAYRIAKNNAMRNGESERAATVRAVAYSKNLANFEQVGELGKAMGAFYMFFRPAATGAVRAIEAVAPAWPGSVEAAMERLPPNIKDDPAAAAKYKAAYAKKALNARIMTGSLIGLGMMAYAMAQMFADDDDLGRNAVATDNMQQWTRFARFHVPSKISTAMGMGEDLVFQIPWGFGLGAFAASGAQAAAYLAGAQSFKDMAQNIFLQISLDSFVPIPVSKMPPLEMPLQFALDSIAPSIVRPVLEFALNKNGLGQDIYNDQNRRFGDAYTGGDKIPELYKDISRNMADSTLGEIDISPNTLYFLANSYIDGVSRIAEEIHGVNDLAGGRKEFNPKTDIPLFGSFFGAKSNVDSREFTKVEQKIQDMEKKIKMFESNPEIAAEYMAKHPMDEMIVDMYNEQVNNELKELRSQAKQIRLQQGYTPKERQELLKIINYQQNLVKYQMIETFKAYGVEP